MGAPVVPTDIANLALDVIKTENIENIADPGADKIAVTMSRWYDVSRRLCLEGFPWVFASRRFSIPLNATPPAFGYTDQYVLPNGYLSLNFIEDEDLPLSQWTYTIEDGNILIDYSGEASLPIGYVYDLDDPVKYSAAFKIYLAHQLAFFTVFKLTGNNPITNRIQALLKPARLEAQAVNGLICPPKAFRQSKMLAARRISRYR
jgi:hypothetical protein